MSREGVTGSRIRERRSIVGLKQAELAQQLGISASYLNLIEHNRRRIGGKLLLNIAALLGVEPSMLTEGAEATLIAGLRDAALAAHLPETEVARADELAGRFAAWAEVMAANHRRITTLERTIETMTDRLAHDPNLAASLHEVLSTAASIRSTAGILAEEKDLDPAWRDRFHVNINQDSERLAESSKAVMRYLDAGQVQTEAASSPQEEVEAFLADVNYDFEALEHTPGIAQSWISDSRILRSNSARIMAREVLEQVLRDAALLPLAGLHAAMGEGDPDPVALARGLDRPLPLVLRRLAVLPELNAGLVVCDRSGSLLFRKPAPGFVIPRYGAACALWPLFAVLSQPGRIELSPLVQLGRGRAGFACFAVSEVVGTPSYNAAPLVQGTMLLLPRKEVSDGSGREVGSSCRVCPRAGCPGRREPSVLSDDA